MLISVDRFTSTKKATLSLAKIDGEFECFGLEDEYRSEKVFGETRIPAGAYKLKVRKHGRFREKYSKRFPSDHRGMIEICDVPNFTDILIHIGNDEDDTAGCYIVGTGANTQTPHDFNLISSTIAYLGLYRKVIDVVEHGNAMIEFLDNDHERFAH